MPLHYLFSLMTFRLLLFVFCFSPYMLFAQYGLLTDSDISNYRRALELMDKEMYGAAIKEFETAVKIINNPQDEISVLSEYYAAYCSIELFHRDADYRMREFIRHNPESPNTHNAYFQLGKFNFRKKQYKDAIEWYEKIDEYELKKEELHEYHYRLGYSYFSTNKFDNASKHFYEIKDIENAYSAPAKYYYSHIAYDKENYETSLKGFLLLQNNERFSMVIPYYITQIYYKQGKYDKLIEYAPALLDTVTPKREAEISRLIGEAYFETKKYTEAIPYFEKYIQKTSRVSEEDRYKMGLLYHKAGDCNKAVEWYSKCSYTADALAQNALYNMAKCYVELDQKNHAKNAFLSAHRLNFDEEIMEDALFNYAKLSYELSFDPYNRSVNAFMDYIKMYPNSPRSDEVHTYLVNFYLTNKNYDAVLQSIDKIAKPDNQIKEAYQRVAFNKATQLYQNRKYTDALAYFKLAQKHSINTSINAQTHYWLGETLFRLGNYTNSIVEYDAFVYSPGAILEKEFNTAAYNTGYAYFKLKNYDKAIIEFRKFTNTKSETDYIRLIDAYLRIGDCYFISKRYTESIDYYNKALKLKRMDADYALYQIATAYGTLGNSNQRINHLESLVENYPSSTYVDAAKYQLGRSYITQENDNKALIVLSDLVEQHPNSPFVKKALVSIGLIYFNARENDKALVVFQRIVRDYPNYDDTKEALHGIKNIYVEKGMVDEYAQYINSLSFVNLTETALDSTTYEAAEMMYLNNDCKAAIDAFGKYLNKFKPANFEINANFYKAQCHINNKEYENALIHLDEVISLPLNKFTESALVQAADLKWRNESYAAALVHYEELQKVASYKSNISQAIIGKMRCLKKLAEHARCIDASKEVLQLEKLESSIATEAFMNMANAHLALNELSEAEKYFRIVKDTTRSEYSAEAKYRIAQILYKKDSLSEAEQMIFTLVNQVPSYEIWIAKGLLLLADVYLARNDLFQAKATLQSIVENFEGDADIVNTAKANLEKIKLLETPKGKDTKDEIEIDFDEGSLNYNNLFEEEKTDDDKD